jgi:adenylyltransferase/sulfurtransferase
MSAPTATVHPVLTPEALSAIYAQAVREHPNECCGFVFGPKNAAEANRVHPCVNVQDRLHAEDPAMNPRDARTAYQFEVRELLTVSKSLRGAEPTKIIYHSHVDRPGDGAYFSDTDQKVAQIEGEPWYAGVEYVVVDVQADGVRGAAQFAWSTDQRMYVEVARYDRTGTVRT